MTKKAKVQRQEQKYKDKNKGKGERETEQEAILNPSHLLPGVEPSHIPCQKRGLPYTEDLVPHRPEHVVEMTCRCRYQVTDSGYLNWIALRDHEIFTYANGPFGYKSVMKIWVSPGAIRRIAIARKAFTKSSES